jgi:hypothetical protein
MTIVWRLFCRHNFRIQSFKQIKHFLSWRAPLLSINFVMQSIAPYLLSKGQFKISCIQFVNA